MPNKLKDVQTTDKTHHPYILEENVSILLKGTGLPIRVNVYRPKSEDLVPVLVTFGPYGKDVPYAVFNPNSFAEVNEKHKSQHSAWETPDPLYWTKNGYAVVRGDEAGIGQSPGILDTLSRRTTEAFYELIEWSAEQTWSSGKVGLLGISYYAATQWKVAALKPKGLSAICPWEGLTDNYRDNARHGGILSNSFLRSWWDKQIKPHEYGVPGRAASGWCPDTIEGDLSEAERSRSRRVMLEDTRSSSFRDDEYFASKEFDLSNVQVPVLSVANWGGISLHLRGNIQGFIHAGSKFKYLRTIVGRHDLPFYYDDEVRVQKSWFDAWLKDDDRVGWTQKGKVPAVDLVLRKGNVGYNDPEAEKLYERRQEGEWPLARTQYTKFYLTPNGELTRSQAINKGKMSYRALGNIKDPNFISFFTAPFEHDTEITGHSVARLSISVTQDLYGPMPSDIDVFVTLRYLGPDGREVHYTGTVGDPAPLAKGWLRATLRQVNKDHSKHRDWLPHRDYTSKDVLPVIQGEVYTMDVEIWPTTVIADQGGRIVFEVASGDTQGSGIFLHDDPEDR
ncbi:hypothetical protein AG0111_0g12239 [Alternaria gaisen]|uniref:Uncharacterized protein n=1 Tax=Alternaria gaisen TaxID=167740 RepID=A0ACB6F4N3_9PLEO|nr:hypothetical protein AG0111_0g12239 [Alternaria gaisen]